jgi:acetylornithine deacetylase
VLEWYEGRDRPFDLDRVRAEYAAAVQRADGVQPGIIEFGGRPVGYVQWYRLGPFAEEYRWPPGETVDGVWGVDLFLGEPSLWGTGLGTRALRALADHLLVGERASRVVIDPRTVNVRAIRSYEKVGFRTRWVIPDHEAHEGRRWESTIMALDADDDVAGIAAALARIGSINPGLVAGASGERDVAERVAAWGEAHGCAVHRSDAAPGRPNVVLVRRGRGGGRSLLFNGHLDTVGVSGPATAEVRLDGGRLVGRGVLDTKGGLAAAMAAVVALDGEALRGDVIIAAVADEEHGSLGTEALVREWSADAAVVLEPTDLVVVDEHRGFAVIDVVVEGRAAHTSRPDRGANAVHAAAAVVDTIRALDATWADGGADPVRRPSALVSGIVSGGETFTVPPRCRLTVEVRTSGTDAPGQIEAVLDAVGAMSGMTDGCAVTATVAMARPPLSSGAGAVGPGLQGIAAALSAALARAGVAGVVGPAPYWTDAALHASSGTPAVVVGPLGEGLHEDEEWVDLASLRTLAAAFADLARTWTA